MAAGLKQIVDFGPANAGGVPTFQVYKRVDTMADIVPAPAFVEIGSGQYYFVPVWGDFDTITYQCSLNGIPFGGVITAPSAPGALPAVPAAVPLTGFQTALQIIDRAAKQLGLGPVSDAFGSIDPKIVQLIELLATAGQRLAGKFRWGQLRREFTWIPQQGVLTYALPEDFMELVPQTEWNRSSLFPVWASSPQQAAMLKARSVNATIDVLYELVGSQIVHPIQPPVGAELALTYLSGWWVQSNGAANPDGDTPTANDDWLLFDPLLLVCALKLEYLGEKGFDTSKAQADYDDALDDAKAKNKAPAVLDLSGRPVSGAFAPFLSPLNLPTTGWGQ